MFERVKLSFKRVKLSSTRVKLSSKLSGLMYEL